jgi:hypothetical protein
MEAYPEKLEACLEKMEATTLEANPEEMQSKSKLQEAPRKRPQWKLLEY